MNNFLPWLKENKFAAGLGAFFVISTIVLGWLIYSSWEDYAAAQAEYSSKAAQITTLANKKPFPNKENLAKVSENLDQLQVDLGKLTKILRGYNVSPFNHLDQVKPQDLPQQFQDALRAEVTRIKSLSDSSGATLPPGFYLGLEEYENALPKQEETIGLAKQLTVLSWMAETLVTQKGLILAEFGRGSAKSSTNKESSNPSKKSTTPTVETQDFQSLGLMRMSFRSSQGSFRDIINSISSSPQFLVIEDLQLQNTSTEPPHRDATPQSSPAAVSSNPGDGTPIQRLPIIVGRELLNASLKIRVLEFPVPAASDTHPNASPKN